ncbi:MAG: sel1 repeat family protein [Betaproteobacteria bacterium]|nr:sel1 repeat family protein [Betaproteobacteria bacterium]
MKAALPIVLLTSALSWGAHAHEGYDNALKAYSCVDYPKALTLFKQYADQGHGLSQYMSGIMLEQGQGADADVKAAYDWYMKAAKQGLADAYYALGDMYMRGVFVPRDKVQANAWFQLASQGGHKLSNDMLAEDSLKLSGEQADKAAAFIKGWIEKLQK